GVAAHPGHAYDDGRNAIEEMSRKIIQLQAITPKEKDRDYSVCVSTIKGGTVVNGVPDHCEIMMDVRVKSLKALQECRKKMEEVCAVTYIDGTSTELIMTDAMIPFESTPQVLSAYKAVKEISDE